MELIDGLFIGSVIKAFDLGVSSMKKGEKAVLTCAPEYAYGEAGSPPNIGPNATLIFEVFNLNNFCFFRFIQLISFFFKFSA